MQATCVCYPQPQHASGKACTALPCHLPKVASPSLCLSRLPASSPCACLACLQLFSSPTPSRICRVWYCSPVCHATGVNSLRECSAGCLSTPLAVQVLLPSPCAACALCWMIALGLMHGTLDVFHGTQICSGTLAAHDKPGRDSPVLGHDGWVWLQAGRPAWMLGQVSPPTQNPHSDSGARRRGGTRLLRLRP